MAKKHKKAEIKRVPTKRQLAKWQQQRRGQHIALVIGGLFLVFVLSYVGYGYYTNEIEPLHQPAVKVNEAVFNMDYYLEALRLYSRGQDPARLSIIANMVVGFIQDNELMRQGAEELGVRVKDEEIDKELKRLNLPNNKVYRDIVSVPLLRDKLMAEHFSVKVPSAGEQVRVQAMFLESKEVAKEVTNKLEGGGDFASLAKEFSEETQTRAEGGDLGWVPKGWSKLLVGSLVLEKAAFSLEPGKLSQPEYDADVTKNVGYWLIKVVDKNPEKGTQLKAILVGTKEEAERIRTRIEAGEDFATLAKEYSQHEESKGRGGDLGWIKEEIISSAFSKVAFALKPGELSKPVRDGTVQTKGGYWLVKVLEKDSNRPLEAEIREKLKSQAFSDWFSGLKAKAKLENYIDEEKRSWALARISKEIKRTKGR